MCDIFRRHFQLIDLTNLKYQGMLIYMNDAEFEIVVHVEPPLVDFASSIPPATTTLGFVESTAAMRSYQVCELVPLFNASSNGEPPAIGVEVQLVPPLFDV
jgi:hypothetical protein